MAGIILVISGYFRAKKPYRAGARTGDLRLYHVIATSRLKDLLGLNLAQAPAQLFKNCTPSGARGTVSTRAPLLSALPRWP